MSMTIPQALEWWRARLGRSIQFPVIPPLCEQVMARARAAGIPVGNLYIVSRPLDAETLGTFDQSTGDICCHYEASQGVQGQRDVIQSLLILLAGLKLKLALPETIAQDWENTRQAIEEGYALAQRWDYTDLFPVEDFARLLARGTELAYGHHLAAELAGSHLPWVARRAYLALSARRKEAPLLDTPERFTEALSGMSADVRANDTMVLFDRSLLRERWVANASRPKEESASFGELTIPFAPRSARILRAALARAATWTRNAVAAQGVPTWFHEITEETDLAVVIRIINSWLIETHPQAAVRLYSWAYGDGYRLATGSPRIYRLSLTYEDAPIDEPHTRDLWVLFAARPTNEQRAMEGAWQAFLTSWLAWSEALCEPLANGLQLLWMLQGGQS